MKRLRSSTCSASRWGSASTRFWSGTVAQAPTDSCGFASIIWGYGEGVLDPDIVPVTMAEAIFESTVSLFDQAADFGENPASIVRMQCCDPELLFVAHLPRCVPHDRIQIVAHEGASIVARHLRRIDDGGARPDHALHVVHHGPW